MIRKFLVPLDGSSVGEAALKHVAELMPKLTSAQVKYQVTLLQVITSLTHYVVAGEATAQVPYTEKEIEYIKKKSREYLNKAGEGLRNMGATVKTKVATGKAAEEILKVADEIKAELIAMSTHGRTGLSRLTFGSVTDKVLRGANIPVLVVRAPKDTEAT